MDKKAIFYTTALANVPIVGNELITIIKKQDPIDYKNLIVLAFVRKIVRLIEAIKILIENDFAEEAQVLSRSLFESKITFDYFLILAEKNYDGVFDKIIDCMMLEKIKQLESLDYRICPKGKKSFWLDRKKDIHNRYPNHVLKRMKSYGFTGISIEERSKATDNAELYDLFFRLSSRSVHSSDLAESIMPYLSSEESNTDYDASRFNMILEVMFICASSILEKANEWIGGPLKLHKFGLARPPEE